MKKRSKTFHDLKRKIASSRGLQVGLFVAAFALVGAGYIIISRAATPTVSFNADTGTLSGQARLISDSNSSNGQAVQFGSTSGCNGVPMTQGQADINNNPGNTTFCLSGTHNWTLTPKSGNTIIGDGTAILDGNDTTQYAVIGNSGVTNVTLRNIEVRNYNTANQHGAINAWQAGTGWVFDNITSHDNGYFGLGLPNGGLVLGGRYYNNGQGGIQGGGQDNWTVDGAEIDHNNFTDNSYTTRNIDCGFEAGGMKWVGDNVTVKNSKVHNNACKGLWADIGAVNNTIINNQVYDNWDEGIFFEISTGVLISGNTVYGNGFHDISNNPPNTNYCNWGWGGGITVSTSGKTQNGTGTVTITNNNVYDNCNGITLIDQNRTDGGCSAVGRCMLMNVNVSNNTITGTTRANSSGGNHTGTFPDAPGSNPAAQNIIFGPNTINPPMDYCKLSC